MSDRVFISPEQAKSCLPDGEHIHAFKGGGFTLLGFDLDRGRVVELLDTKPVELAGDVARGMDHGIVVHADDGPLFIETVPDALAKLDERKEPTND